MKLSVGLLLCLSMLSLAARAAAPQAVIDEFPRYADASSAALWLFDEPLYPHPLQPEKISDWIFSRTLIDAAPHYNDLYFLEGAQIVPGKFGNALRILGGQVKPVQGLPTTFATQPRVGGLFLPGDESEEGYWTNLLAYTEYPDDLMDTLGGESFTIEFWLQLEQTPTDPISIIDMGQGRQREFVLEFDPAQKGRLKLTHGRKWSGTCALGVDRLADGAWHHVALVKSGTLLTSFIDGAQSSTGAIERNETTDDSAAMKPGLVARFFATPQFSQPQETRVIEAIDGNWRESRGRDWSVRMTGYLRAPHTGEVKIKTDEKRGLHLDVDNRPILYGWVGHSEKYRDTTRISRRQGELKMHADKWVPLRAEFHFNELESSTQSQQLYWSWEGQPWTPIPSSALMHNAGTLKQAEADEGRDALSDRLNWRFNLVLGSNRDGDQAMSGKIDEFHISRGEKYKESFTPASLSVNQTTQKVKAETPPKLPLLFADDYKSGPIELGSRRHVLIDDAIFENVNGLRWQVSPPAEPELTNIYWTGDLSIYDRDNQVQLFAPRGYEQDYGDIRLFTSKDGLTFTTPTLGLIEWEGNKENNILIGDVPSWGRAAPDSNPHAAPEAHYKFSAFIPMRGTILFMSPDGIHWRRNETLLMQPTSGGGSEWFYDDQRQIYTYLLKWDHSPTGRASVYARTSLPLQAWPMVAATSDSQGLMTPYGEMPILLGPDEKGEVYRTRAFKYAWAPDTYFAFVWRFNRAENFRQTELAVSRDGEHWKSYGGQWYIRAGGTFHGNEIVEAIGLDGLVRRGDELWQYAALSGMKHGDEGKTSTVRLRQRVDGFVGMTAGEQPGEAKTYPLKIAKGRLIINAIAQGKISVALLDQKSNPIPGFGFEDCDFFTGDAVDHSVTWRGKQNLSAISEQPVRVAFRLSRSQLFAFQFVPAEGE